MNKPLNLIRTEARDTGRAEYHDADSTLAAPAVASFDRGEVGAALESLFLAALAPRHGAKVMALGSDGTAVCIVGTVGELLAGEG